MKQDFKIKIESGEDLLNDGITEDFMGQPVVMTKDYELRIFEQNGEEVFFFLTNEDWGKLYHIDRGNKIVDMGGISNWCESELEKGTLANRKACIIQTIHSKDCYVREQDYEMAAYLYKEIKSFKEKHGL